MKLRKADEGIEELLEDGQWCWWESVEEWFFMAVMHGCGCGSGDLGADCLTVLKSMEQDEEQREFINLGAADEVKARDERYYELILHWLRREELTEHGGGVFGSWLSEKGEEVLRAVKEVEGR